MRVNLVVPPWSNALAGFNESVRNEISAYFLRLGWTVTEVSADAQQPEADVILVSAQSREDCRSCWLAHVAPQTNSDCVVGVYGKAATAERLRILRSYPGVDFVVRGEPHLVAQRIAADPPSKDQLDSLPGITLRQIDGYRDTDSLATVGDFDQTPMPSFKYLEASRSKHPVCVLHSSYGCSGVCNFCEGKLHRDATTGTTFRAKSAERILDEVAYVKNHHGRRVFAFADDNFLVDGSADAIRRAYEFARLVQSKNIRFRFTIECRADDVDPDLFRELRAAGLVKVFVGFESDAASVLDRYEKHTSPAINEEAARTLQELGIRCEPGYILFDPLTTRSELAATTDFLRRYQFDSPEFGEGTGALYFPTGSKIVDALWPDADHAFRQAVAEGASEHPFISDEGKKLHSAYLKVLATRPRARGERVLDYRMSCLEDVLTRVPAGSAYGTA